MADKLEFSGSGQPSAAQVYDELRELSLRTEQARARREKSSAKAYIISIISLAAAVVFLSIALIVVGVGWSMEQGTVVPEVVEVEKEVVVEVPTYTIIDPSVEYEHTLSEEGFILNDSHYGPIRMPIVAGVERNTYASDLFVTDEETGYMTYSGPENYIAGVDVSVYQGDIDWEAVRSAGFEFAMIRCGNRGYVTGLINEDANFRQNIRGALDAGLQVGVYFFSQALTPEEAFEEADFVIDSLNDFDGITFPIAYDWEVVSDPDGDTARTAYIDPEQLTDNFLVFAQRLAVAGYETVLYANKKTTVWKYDLARLSDYDIWYAEYNDTPSLPYKWEIWQYRSDGKVPGVKGNVDLNIAFKDYGAEIDR